jgi:hypothetical protein
MGPGIAYTPNLARCLQLNALALAFSLAHTVADYGVIFATTDFNTWGVAAYLGVSGAVYGWWGWSMAQAARGSRAALPSLLALSGIWAVLHGATFPFTPLTYILADIIHFGSLLFGLWAAYATWRVLRGGRVRTLHAWGRSGDARRAAAPTTGGAGDGSAAPGPDR